MRTDLSPDTDISLLPRADLPVIWDAFRAKAELVRATAETLTVTSIDQKEQMALARTTRLTLKEIRIAVENKRVELGESHLKEIRRVNGAATAIKEFIQPLEARLLIQEEFGERAEADRIVELSKRRNDEIRAVISSSIRLPDLGKMSQADYDEYLAVLIAERAHMEETKRVQAIEQEAANRLRIEAEKRLAEARAEALRVAEVTRAEVERQQKETAAILNAKLAVAEAEREAEKVKAAKAQAEADACYLRKQAEYRQQQEEQDKLRRQQQAEQAARLAAAEAELAAIALDAARKEALEEKRLRDIKVAPDVEKLKGYIHALLSVPLPCLKDSAACFVLQNVVDIVNKAARQVELFSK